MGKKTIEPVLTFDIMLNGDKWEVSLYTYHKFLYLYANTMGICHYNHKTNDRTLIFRGPAVSKDTIAHELMHAYCSYHDFSKSSSGKIEEKVCEILGKKHKYLYNLTNLVYSKLHKRRKCKNAA